MADNTLDVIPTENNTELLDEGQEKRKHEEKKRKAPKKYEKYINQETKANGKKHIENQQNGKQTRKNKRKKKGGHHCFNLRFEGLGSKSKSDCAPRRVLFFNFFRRSAADAWRGWLVVGGLVVCALWCAVGCW